MAQFRILLAVPIMLLACPKSECSVIYPSDAGVINVKTAYGAKGDGVTDDTKAIQAAIRDHVGSADQGILYFPSGTYLVSNTLEYIDRNGNWGAYLTLQGQSETSTIIKLADRAPGFQYSSSPKSVIFTASNNGSSIRGATGYNPDGSGNQGFRNHIMELTVNTGSGNAGAVGIDYMANNNTRISDVSVVSGDGSGAFGISIQRGFPGPMLLKNLTIRGFSVGIGISNSLGVWIEHASLSGQQTSGIDVNSGSASIRDLQSQLSGPAVRIPSWSGVVSIVDSKFNGGASAVSAVELGSLLPTVFVRNTQTTGYASAISEGSAPVAGTSLTEWTSEAPTTLFQTGPVHSLNLRIAETPVYSDPGLSHWANIVTFGAKAFNPANGTGLVDNTKAIQDAIDSGAKTVYFPTGLYIVANTIHVRGSVQRLLGLNATLLPLSSSAPGSAPALQIDSLTSRTVFVDSLLLGTNYWITGYPAWTEQNIVNNSSATLVLTNAEYVGYRNTSAGFGGTVFMEGVFGNSGFSFTNQTVYARNLDPENWTSKPHVSVSGGSLWVLGLKTEGDLSPVLANVSGASTEILGEFFSLSVLVPSAIPMTAIQNSSVTLAAFRGNGGSSTDYQVQVQEQTGSVTKELFRNLSGLTPSLPLPYGGGSAGSLFSDIH